MTSGCLYLLAFDTDDQKCRFVCLSLSFQYSCDGIDEFPKDDSSYVYKSDDIDLVYSSYLGLGVL